MVLFPSLRSGLALGTVLAVAFTSGCASTVRPGPGSTRPYTVGGRTYAPLASWQGYRAEGIASYYGRGDGYHGRTTANGERFDASAFTAAHPTLPMNTCVSVASERTGARTVVRVNDRGPFAKGRIIDLSAAAADALGMTGSGTAKVRLEAIAGADRQGACPGASDTTVLSRLKAWVSDLI